MPVSHSDLIDFAYKSRLSHDETIRRAALSRGYYACYHFLLEKLHYYNGIVGTSSHKALTEYLTSSACSQEPYDGIRLKALGLTLHQQKASRVMADYRLNAGVDEKVCESCVEKMKGLYHRIEQLKEPE